MKVGRGGCSPSAVTIMPSRASLADVLAPLATTIRLARSSAAFTLVLYLLYNTSPIVNPDEVSARGSGLAMDDDNLAGWPMSLRSPRWLQTSNVDPPARQ